MPRRARQPRNGSGSVTAAARLSMSPPTEVRHARAHTRRRPLARATTSPSEYYLDPALVELEHSDLRKHVAHWDDPSRQG